VQKILTFSNLFLVFISKQPMFDGMAQLPWYRRLLSKTTKSGLNATLAKAEGGDADAQFGLGLKYSVGTGIAQDFARAAEWYRKAADQNHALAQFNLAVMFDSGQGVPQDHATALGWIRKAAEGGDAGAQFSLGTRYHRNSLDNLQMDLVESRVEAYKWFYLAAAQGYKGSAAACERVTFGMTREQVADGNRRAAAFLVRKPTDLQDHSCCATAE
jgi:TPR repeat protein